MVSERSQTQRAPVRHCGKAKLQEQRTDQQPPGVELTTSWKPRGSGGNGTVLHLDCGCWLHNSIYLSKIRTVCPKQ